MKQTINHNPCIKPQVVSLSGGRTSGYLARIMQDKVEELGWNVHFVFMDTGAEAPETYEFIRNIVKHWGIKLTVIRTVVHPEMNVGVTYREISIDEMGPDLHPWKDMIAKYGVPTINTPYCTSRMKTEPHDKWCDDNFGKGNYTTWLGIRADEPQRLTYYDPNFDMFSMDVPEERAIRYLAELDLAGKPQINEWWSKQPFDLGIEDYAGNCVFCIKKGANKLYAAAQAYPDMAQKFRDMLHADEVRVKESDKYGRGVIYRGKMSIDDVIRMGRVLDKHSLADALRMDAEYTEDDPTMCSESCEVMPGQPVKETQQHIQYEAA